MSYLLLACRVMLVGVFVVSLLSKLHSRKVYLDFQRSVADWRVLPGRWSARAAAGAVAGEASVVLLLALPWTVPVGFVVGALLLVAFTVGMSVVLRRTEDHTCRCFGATKSPLSVAHLVRNLLLVGVCVAGTVGAAVATVPPLTGRGSVLALSAAAVGVLLTVRFDDLMVLKG